MKLIMNDLLLKHEGLKSPNVLDQNLAIVLADVKSLNWYLNRIIFKLRKVYTKLLANIWVGHV